MAIGETSNQGRDHPCRGRRERVGRAGHVRAAARAAEGPPVRRVRDAPVRDAAEPAADAEGALAERDAVAAAALRDVARQLVPPQERPALDHRVRLRDEAGRAARRHERAAGPVPEAGRAPAAGEPARADVHLVHLPRLEAEPVAERAPEPGRGEEAGLPHVLGARAHRRRRDADDPAAPRADDQARRAAASPR